MLNKTRVSAANLLDDPQHDCVSLTLMLKFLSHPMVFVTVLLLLSGIAQAQDTNAINSGDTTWVLVSSALVMFMTPGLAFFYAGLVRQKNALNAIMMSFSALGVISLLWVTVGYSLAFAPGNALIGGLQWFGLRGVGLTANPDYSATVPHQAFMIYQMMFAIITPAVISGAIVERMKFKTYLLFMVLWSLLIYAPLAHWVWGVGGWLRNLGVIDFAGGTVVEIASGMSALAAAFVVGQRRGYPKAVFVPHNVPLVMLGAGILWVGWFGFNAGGSMAGNGVAVAAFVNTNLGAAAALSVWMLLEILRIGKPTAVGAATGAVVGLVAVTPGAGFVEPFAAIAIAAIAALVSYSVIQIKTKLGADDSLDVFACHGTAGIVGTLLLGVFASKTVNAFGADGLLYGHAAQLGIQAIGVLAAAAFAFFGTAGILLLLKYAIGVRVSSQSEEEGLDLSEHGESALHEGNFGFSSASGALGSSVVIQSGND
jgi:ammonium transporter, Amt family